ncbi:hypothetical protein B0H13DRAFT_2537687 [Mycena leptocephala]|nr:hypothetical protein B0H13DRAFT_2537687 [Mycena leptocephala]
MVLELYPSECQMFDCGRLASSTHAGKRVEKGKAMHRDSGWAKTGYERVARVIPHVRLWLASGKVNAQTRSDSGDTPHRVQSSSVHEAQGPCRRLVRTSTPSTESPIRSLLASARPHDWYELGIRATSIPEHSTKTVRSPTTPAPTPTRSPAPQASSTCPLGVRTRPAKAGETTGKRAGKGKHGDGGRRGRDTRKDGTRTSRGKSKAHVVRWEETECNPREDTTPSTRTNADSNAYSHSLTRTGDEKHRAIGAYTRQAKAEGAGRSNSGGML